jgi:molybdate transport system regulatory protein
MSEVRARIKLWLVDSDGTVLLGEGRADLLRQIKELGSIAAAARAMNMSYRTAWHLVDSMNAKLPAAVVRTKVGGSEGGKAELTPLGEAILKEFVKLKEEFDQHLAMKAEGFSNLTANAAAVSLPD